MKKILYVATVDSHIKAFHLPYLKMLKENGYEVHVATNGTEQFENCDKKHTICIERSPFKFKNLKAIKQLRKIIQEEKFDIIHCHTPMGSVVTRIAARKARKEGTRVIYTAHGFHFYKGAPTKNWILYYPIEKICSNWTDCLITITTEDYEFAKKHFKCKQIEHINGVGMNTERFNITINQEEKQKLKENLGLNEEDIILSYVAELNDNKNQILLINAMEQLVKDNDKYKLLLVGAGPNKEKYLAEINKRNLKNNIKLLGKRKDVPQILSITNIYVASSIREGLPVNIMEAMYMGVPIVATNNRGHRDLVKNNENGYLVEVGSNVKNFVDKLEMIIQRNELRNKFIKNTKKMVETYKIEYVKHNMEKIYFENN